MFARFVLGAVLGMAVWSAAWAVEGITPDQKFDPAQGVGDRMFGETIEKRDAQRLGESGDKGDSHVDVLPGAADGTAREAMEPPDVVSVRKKTDAPEPAVESDVVAVERVEQRPEWVPEGSVAPVGTGDDEGNLGAIVAALIAAINREPDIRRIGYGSGEPERRGEERREVAQPAKRPLPRVGAGDAFYARVMHAVNSDYPGRC